MSQFVVEKPFWDIFPEVRIALIRVTGLDNHDHGQLPDTVLEEANAHVADLIPDDPISANSLIHEWREAFRKFKTKKGARCAVENLLKRSKNGNPVRSIDPMVDLYNACSLRTGFPVASLDTESIQGDIRLTVAKGGEPFQAISEDEPEPALDGEVIYADDAGVVSRCWCWRDAERVETRDDTTAATMYIECLKPEWQADHEAAVNQLTSEIEQYLGAKTETVYVDAAHSAVDYD